MFICYIYRRLFFDNVYMPIKNLNWTWIISLMMAQTTQIRLVVRMQ